MPMEEGELLRLLKEKFGDSLVERGLGLANGGVRLNKDHRMVRAGGGKMGFKDFGVAAISRSESKVEFDFESLSPQCQSCLLARGTICHHIIATLIAANREAFLSDDDITKMAKSLGVMASIIPISLDLVAQPRLDGGLAEIDPVMLRDQIEKAYAVGNVATSREFIEFWMAKANKEETRTRCLAPNVEILIFATGDVYPCGNIQKPVGNLREDSLENIYQNYRERRKEIRAGSYPPCDECIYPDIIFARGFWQNAERLFKKVLP